MGTRERTSINLCSVYVSLSSFLIGLPVSVPFCVTDYFFHHLVNDFIFSNDER